MQCQELEELTLKLCTMGSVSKKSDITNKGQRCVLRRSMYGVHNGRVQAVLIRFQRLTLSISALAL